MGNQDQGREGFIVAYRTCDKEYPSSYGLGMGQGVNAFG